MTEQTKTADAAAKKEGKASEKSQYQMRKEAEQLVSGWDAGQRKRIFNALLEDWAADLPKKGKDYGVTGSGKQWADRLEWLREQLGSSNRKMSLSSVLELLTLFTLKAAESTEAKASFGVLDDGSKLAEAVVPALRAMKDAVGPKLEISRSTYAQMKQLQEERDAMTPEEFGKKYDEIMSQLQG